MNPRKSRLVSAALAAAVLLAAAAAPAQAELLGPNGIIAPTGINPETGAEWKAGDQYYLIFLTSTSIAARNVTDIATYDAHVNAAADLSTLPGVAVTTWYCLGSTSAVAALDRPPLSGGSMTHPIYLLGSTSLDLVANNEADLWDGTIRYNLNRDENGNVFTPHSVWTGTNSNGTINTSNPLGSSLNSARGKPGATNSTWVNDSQTANNTARPLYAISEVLIVAAPIPEPGTLVLLAMGLLGLGLYAWRKRRR